MASIQAGKVCMRYIDGMTFSGKIIAHDTENGTTIQYDDDANIEGPLHFDPYELVIVDSIPIGSQVADDSEIQNSKSVNSNNCNSAEIVTKDRMTTPSTASTTSSQTTPTQEPIHMANPKRCISLIQIIELKQELTENISHPSRLKTLDDFHVVNCHRRVKCRSKSRSNSIHASPSFRINSNQGLSLNLLPFGNRCIGCDKWTQYRCIRCNSTFYCSRECQRKHWSQHKSKCFFDVFYPQFQDTSWLITMNNGLSDSTVVVTGGDASIRCQIRFRSPAKSHEIVNASKPLTSISKLLSSGINTDNQHQQQHQYHTNTLPENPLMIKKSNGLVSLVPSGDDIQTKMPQSANSTGFHDVGTSSGIVGVNLAPRKTNPATIDAKGNPSYLLVNGGGRSSAGGINPSTLHRNGTLSYLSSSLDTCKTQCMACYEDGSNNNPTREGSSSGGTHGDDSKSVGNTETGNNNDNGDDKYEDQVRNLCDNLGLIEADVRAALISFRGDADQAAEWCLSNPGQPPPPPLVPTIHPTVQLPKVRHYPTLPSIRDDINVNISRQSYATMNQDNKRRMAETTSAMDASLIDYAPKAVRYDRYDPVYRDAMDGYDAGGEDNENDDKDAGIDNHPFSNHQQFANYDETTSSPNNCSTWTWENGGSITTNNNNSNSNYCDRDGIADAKSDAAAMGISSDAFHRKEDDGQTVYYLRDLADSFCYFCEQVEILGRQCIVNLSQPSYDIFATKILIRPSSKPKNVGLLETEFLTLFDYSEWDNNQFTHTIRVDASSMLALLRCSVTNGQECTLVTEDLSSELLRKRAMAIISFIRQNIYYSAARNQFCLTYKVVSPKSSREYAVSEPGEFSKSVNYRLLKAKPYSGIELDPRSPPSSEFTTPPRSTTKSYSKVLPVVFPTTIDDVARKLQKESLMNTNSTAGYTPLNPTDRHSPNPDDLADSLQSISLQDNPTSKRSRDDLYIGTGSSVTDIVAVDTIGEEFVSEADVAILCEFAAVSADRARDALRAAFGDVDRAMERLLT